MSGSKDTELRPTFNKALRIEFRPDRISSSGGAILLREIDERFQLVASLAARLHDPRNLELCTFSMDELLRERLFLVALRMRDLNDADFLRHDPALLLACLERPAAQALFPAGEPCQDPAALASQSSLSRLLGRLAAPSNLEGLRAGLLDMSALARIGAPQEPSTLDIDTLPVSAHGCQPGSEYNGYYEARVFHPCVVFHAGTGDFVAAQLRSGENHTSVGSKEILKKAIASTERYAPVTWIRGDAGFTSGEFLDHVESLGKKYALRIKTNAVLEKLAAPYLKRAVGRPPAELRAWIHELEYQAEGWSRPRRVVLVVKEAPEAELFVEHFFLVTNASVEEAPGLWLWEFYRQRATFEAQLGQFKSALQPSLPSSPRRPRSPNGTQRVKKSKLRKQEEDDAEVARREGEIYRINEANFLLFVLARNLLNLVRALLRLPHGEEESQRSLDWLQKRVLQAPLRIVKAAGRGLRVIVSEGFGRVWKRLWQALDELQPREARQGATREAANSS